jgi:HK97 family phage portal protein
MPNWFSRWLPLKRALRPAPHVEAVAVHNTHAWPNLAEAEAQSRVYQSSPWVYIAVNRIAEAAALVPLHVLRIEGERRQQVIRHPLERLLEAPNPFLSGFELIEQTVGMLELTGNAYWFLAGDASGTPVEIWPLRPDRMSIVPDARRFIKGYVYEVEGARVPLEAAEVVHFKRWHPANDYYGLSALEAARQSISTDRAMAEWNRNTFGQENGVPAGIVTIKDRVSEADLERLKREWRQSYGGPQRRTAFLTGDQISWQNIGLGHTDLDFLNGRRANRDEILNLFGIPVGMLSENATEANATVAERLFIERTLWPKLVRIAARITTDLLPFWPGEAVARFEDIRPTDSQARLDEIRAAYPVLSVNEIRQRYFQLGPVTWGEMAPDSWFPVSGEEKMVAGSRLPVSGEEAHGSKAYVSNSELPSTDNPLLTPGNPEPATGNSLDELLAWERFTLKRWGRSQPRPFEVRALPEEVAFSISAGLLAAGSPAEARQVFALARAELADRVPPPSPPQWDQA